MGVVECSRLKEFKETWQLNLIVNKTGSFMGEFCKKSGSFKITKITKLYTMTTKTSCLANCTFKSEAKDACTLLWQGGE